MGSVIRTTPTINRIQVFLASPGGVEAEREAVRAVATELNKSLSEHGWDIEVLGWEDRGPATGRAQADINADVDRCQIFVGLLGSRWGTPTGSSSSGFHEEWLRAKDRYDKSGVPELWLYFKTTDLLDTSEPQQSQVLDFRAQVEDSEAAFHKPFQSTDEFETLFRSRLLTEVLERTRLSRSEIGTEPLDWSLAFSHEPSWLVDGGRDREALATQLVAEKPAEAATLFAALADDVAAIGFDEQAKSLRRRACEALFQAGRSCEGMAALRSILRDHVWWARLDQTRSLLQTLRDDMPPESAEEWLGWRACADAVLDPGESATRLRRALSMRFSIPLDPSSRILWEAVAWRCDLDAGHPHRVADGDEPDYREVDADIALDAQMVRADALRAGGSADAELAWQTLRTVAIQTTADSPAHAAWIITRFAADLVARQDTAAASEAYLDAAARWSRVPGGQAQASAAFISAQVARQLGADFDPRGWGWRSAAFERRRGTPGLLQRAEELERRAMQQRLAERDDEALASLTAARWCHQRAGFIHGAIRNLVSIADLHKKDNPSTAVELYCRVGNSSGAKDAAQRVSPQSRPDVVRRLARPHPRWAAEAQARALAIVGRSVPSDAAALLITPLIEQTRVADNGIRMAAAEALAAVALGANSDDALARLTELASESNFVLSRAGRDGLRMYCDIADGVEEIVDHLIDLFATDDQTDAPDVDWIASHLKSGQRLDAVAHAASVDRWKPLVAIIQADLVGDEVRRICETRTERMLNSNLGYTSDGRGVHGLMALDANATIASAVSDPEIRQAAAEQLLTYALEDRWPMTNRVRAAWGLMSLVDDLDHEEWTRRLRPLAQPDADLDDGIEPFWRQQWARKGELQAVALRVIASITDSTANWLAGEIRHAQLDRRQLLRAHAWYAAGSHADWFDPTAALFALTDESDDVRRAAAYAWTQQSPEPLPRHIAARVAQDPSNGVLFELIWMAERHSDEMIANALVDHPDAYVRGVARKQLQPAA
jgi:hypothetical protein